MVSDSSRVSTLEIKIGKWFWHGGTTMGVSLVNKVPGWKTNTAVEHGNLIAVPSHKIIIFQSYVC
jgi:hypothetical protein